MRFAFAQLIRNSLVSRTSGHGSPEATGVGMAPCEPSATAPSEKAPVPSPEQPLLPPDKEAVLLEALKAAFPHGRLGCDDWRPIVEAELRNRQYWFKYRYIPWMNSVLPLNGARVLEIGAGTGSSTIPLLECGAYVTSIDISDVDLQIAELRARLHGLADRVAFHQINAADIGLSFQGGSFDLIVYLASLEHMTYQERLASLRSAWSLLPSGRFLGVCDTPNRLWYYDEHTALQHFFHWLPDEVALDYARRTPRPKFNEDFLARHADSATRLQRWGRCVSYHEFEVALDLNVRDLEVYGEWQYRRERDDPQWWAEVWMKSKDGTFHSFLKSVAPQLPLAFIEPELAFMMRKP